MSLSKFMVMEQYQVIFFMTYFSSCLQIVAAILTPINIWRNRQAHGYSISFHILCTIAFLHKYVLIGEEDQFEMHTIKANVYLIQHGMRILLTISIIIAFVSLSVFVDERDFDRFTAWSLGTGFLVGCTLGAKYVTGRTAKDWWMAASYLEIIAWIQQLKLSIKTKPAGRHIMCYIVSMFSYDVLNIFGLSYDFDHLILYGYAGYGLLVLKFLLFCGFFLSYWWYQPSKIQNKIDVTEVVAATPAQVACNKTTSWKKGCSKPICGTCMHGVSTVEQELTARY